MMDIVDIYCLILFSVAFVFCFCFYVFCLIMFDKIEVKKEMKQLSCPFCNEVLEQQKVTKYEIDETIVTGRCPSGHHRVTISIADWKEDDLK